MLRLPFEILVALRFLREGRMQSFLILAGVTGGVAVIIFLTQLIGQLQASIIDRVLGSQAHIVVRPLEEANARAMDEAGTAAIVEPRAQRLRSIDQWESIVPVAESLAGVVAVSPVVSGPGFAVRGSASKAIALLGVDPERYSRVVKMPDYVVRGSFAVSGTNGVIGTELARDLGVGVGDKIRIVTVGNRDEVITIAGVFDIGNKDLNGRWVFVTIKAAQSLLDLAGGVSNIDITVTDIFRADAIADRLRAQTNLTVDSWMRTNAQLLAALRNQTVTNRLIRTFVILIVALGIASVLVVSVVQKQKEIGILRAMGTSSRRVMSVFLLQGAIVGLSGSLLGAGLAFALLSVFQRIYRNADGSVLFSADLAPELVVTACGTAILVGLAAAAIPARRAAKMDPVQAIRA